MNLITTNVENFVSETYHDLLQFINYEEQGKSLSELRLNDGKPVPEEMNSYIVLLCIYLNTTWARCSGSLISENFVLTAGHCTNSDGSNVIVAHGKENLQEYVGVRSTSPIDEYVGEEFNVEERRVKQVYFYPNQTRKKYDLALMKLENPFKVNVSFLDVATKKVHILKNCMSIGYGISEIPKQQLTLGYIVNEPLTLTAPSFKLKDERFCIIRSKRLSSICPGDSGSPLICDKKIWGVTAYGDEKNCKNNLLFCYYPLFRAKKWLSSYGLNQIRYVATPK
ncbi:Chymotrypsin BI precursor, putative [Pediculus humanus corporis]|uniref:Chymotrypsin BI, putative n=1 Tax=Pediculus humanus subsp. corporis TaxID=121224 RepID=E0VML6_PEDHC|nr:Chymotrypsin BI precursor, putative [Pediculus humanus corporis]EEB14622.1 Chymotrypsin BI precursor, putative [Pediculus humanus corporis]